jgi:hypothetical protein
LKVKHRHPNAARQDWNEAEEPNKNSPPRHQDTKGDDERETKNELTLYDDARVGVLTRNVAADEVRS